MKGAHEVKVFNRRVQYHFTLRRNLTILRGDSATGKTTMIDMIQAYQTGGTNSGITLLCDKPCVVLTALSMCVNSMGFAVSARRERAMCIAW